MPFKGISYLELWQPFSLAECNHLCSFGRGYQEELFWIWVSGPGGEFFSLATFLFSGAEPFMQFWKRASWGTFMWSYIKLGPVYQENMSFKEKVYARTDGRLTDDGRRAKTDHNTSHWAFGSGELRTGDIYTLLCLRSAELSKSFGLRNLCYSKIS